MTSATRPTAAWLGSSRGGHAGGLSYGYRSVPTGEIHKLEIVEEKATHVR